MEEYIASLDMGSATMVMALGEHVRGSFRVIGIECIHSEGIERGMIVDKQKVRYCFLQLLSKFEKNYNMRIDTLHVALSGVCVRRLEHTSVLASSREQVVGSKEKV